MPTRRLPLAGLPASRALAQGIWPSRPIVLTVPFAAGGSADVLARLLAERMMPLLGSSTRVLVENHAGAGGAIGSERVRRQPADGHAVLFGTPSTHGALPALQPETTPYEAIADFTPVALLARGPIALAVPRSSPHRDPRSLLAELRASPRGRAGAVRARAVSGTWRGS